MLHSKMRAESRQPSSAKDLSSHHLFPVLIHQRLNVRIFVHWVFVVVRLFVLFCFGLGFFRGV